MKLRAFSSYGEQHFHPIISIGENVHIETDCHISAIEAVYIGDNVLIGSFVYISDHRHGVYSNNDIETAPIKRNLSSKGCIKIEDNVWIGEKVIILPGVTVGKYSIIGAGSIVTKDIPPYCIAAGNPAKIIKQIPHS